MGSSANRGKIIHGEEEEHCSYALQLASSSVLPMVLNAVIRLNVFEIIAKAGPGAQLSPVQIVSQMPTEHRDAPLMLERMLRLLASHSVLTCSSVVESSGGTGGRAYGLTPAAKYFLRNDDGGSFRPLMALIQDKVLMDVWNELETAVLEGGVAFIRTHSIHLFQYAGKDEKFNENFNKAMIHHTRVVVKKILEYYKGFEQLKILVDVGGGLGDALDMITSKYPTLQGINFDLPHVIEHAPFYPRVDHVGGDMFESVPAGDAIFMKWILHNWDDDHCLKLLKNCYKALPENGKVIAVDAIVPMNPDTSSSTKSNTQIDVIMMAVLLPGGRERTEQEFTALATEAGFKGITKRCLVCDLWVMEFCK